MYSCLPRSCWQIIHLSSGTCLYMFLYTCLFIHLSAGAVCTLEHTIVRKHRGSSRSSQRHCHRVALHAGKSFSEINCVIWQNCWIASSYRNQLITSSADDLMTSFWRHYRHVTLAEVRLMHDDAYCPPWNSVHYQVYRTVFSTTAFHKNTVKWPSLSSPTAENCG